MIRDRMTWMIGVLLLAAPSLRGAESKPVNRSTTVAPNAAVIYWQAFAAIPTLKDASLKQYEAAIQAPLAPVSEDLQSVVASFETALHELHRARAVVACDWQLDEAAGPMLRLPHLQKARDLSHAALLRARLRFHAGDSDAAVSDVLDVLKLARDAGSSPIVISFLVDVAIEKNAQTVLAAHLPQLKPDQLDALGITLKQLPETTSMEACVRWEARTFGGWLERQLDAEARKLNDPQAGFQVLEAMQKALGASVPTKPDANDPAAVRVSELLQTVTVEELQASLRQMQTDYDEMAQIVLLDDAEQMKRWADFEARIAKSRKAPNRDFLRHYFSANFLPAISRVAERSDQLQLRRHLMDLAVQVQRHGPEALKTVRNIEHQATATGFELRSETWSKEEVLVVGVKR